MLLLFAPPGSAKSTYVSVLLPSLYLAANSNHSVLAATHNVELPSGGEEGLGTILQQMPMYLRFRFQKTAKQPLDGHLKAEVSITALELESGSRAFEPTLAWLMICLALGRMRTATPSGRNAGTGTWMTSQLV